MNGINSQKTKYELIIAFVLLVILSSFLLVSHYKKTARNLAQGNLVNSSNISSKPDSSATVSVEAVTLKNRCSERIGYSIGNVDPKFNVSEADLVRILLETEKIWEGPAGKDIFWQDQGAPLRINLVFDERQRNIIEAREMERRLEDMKAFHQEIISKYGNANSSYKKRLDDFNREVRNYEDEVEGYNSEVEYWKDRGGAPKDTYDDLKKDKKYLEKVYSRLKEEKDALSKIIEQVNSIAEEEKSFVKTYNDSLATYKKKFGVSTEFDKGVFNGTSIDIFVFRDEKELKLALVHEFGHVLGISHLSDPKSLMYYLMGEQDMDSLSLSPEDVTALNAICQTR